MRKRFGVSETVGHHAAFAVKPASMAGFNFS